VDIGLTIALGLWLGSSSADTDADSTLEAEASIGELLASELGPGFEVEFVLLEGEEVVEDTGEARLDGALHHEAADEVGPHQRQHHPVLHLLGVLVGDPEPHDRDVVRVTELDHDMATAVGALVGAACHATSDGEHGASSLRVGLIGVETLREHDDRARDRRCNELQIVGINRITTSCDRL